MNKKDYPLSILRDLKALLTELRNKGLDYSYLISFTIDEDYNMRFVDKDHSRFTFSVWNPHKGAGSDTLYSVTFLPHSVDSIDKGFTTNANAQQIIHFFEKWVSLLSEYNSFQLDEYD